MYMSSLLEVILWGPIALCVIENMLVLLLGCCSYIALSSSPYVASCLLHSLVTGYGCTILEKLLLQLEWAAVTI